MTARTAGAVLCGGASRRMGVDKAMAGVGGTAMAERVAAALAGGGCDPVVLVGGDPDRLAAIGRPFHADRFPGQGPAGAVLTALAVLAGVADHVVVAACDLPLLSAATVGRLVAARATAPGRGDTARTPDGPDVVVAATERLQPALARWRVAARPALEARWAAGTRSLHGLLEGSWVATVAVDAAELRNVNTPEDLAAAEAALGTLT